jgi:hypothetical protein
MIINFFRFFAGVDGVVMKFDEKPRKIPPHTVGQDFWHWKMCYAQCCGSGSTGFTCFRASRIQILLWIRILLWIWILLSSCKNSKKNIDSYYFVTLFDLLS